MKTFCISTLLGMLIVTSSTCRKKFDEPPGYTGPLVHPNLTIRQLRNMHVTGGFEQISEEYIITGIIVANDSSDNFYKTIVLQDSTAGITIRADGTGLYSMYPVGQKLFIKLKDLWLGDYAKMVQLGAGVDRSDPQYPELTAIPQPLFSRYIIQGGSRNNVVPITTTIEQLQDSLQSCLVTISNTELAPSDTGKFFADPVNKVSANRTIQSCLGAKAYLRTSGFARFAGLRTPRGNGTITAIYSVFRNEKQLMIRDTSDIYFRGLRCGRSAAKQLLTEDFETISTDTSRLGKGWRNLAESGGKAFQVKTIAGNHYAEVSAFASSQPAVVTWLISPPVNLNNSSDEILSFETREGFDNGAQLQILVSANYDGSGTPWKSKWTAVKALIAKGSTNSLRTEWIGSGAISLDNLSGTIYIAFRYEGADPANTNDKRTTSFQVDNIRLQGN